MKRKLNFLPLLYFASLKRLKMKLKQQTIIFSTAFKNSTDKGLYEGKNSPLKMGFCLARLNKKFHNIYVSADK